MALFGMAGLCGTGKTTAIKYLHQLTSGEIVYLGKMLLDQLVSRGLPDNPENERFMQQQLRREQGEAVLANVAGPIIRSHLEAGKHVLIDAVYVRAEYEALIRHCGERSSIVIATHAPFSVRAQRMLSRNERAYSATELRARDLHEVLNLNTGAAIALADFHVVNDGSLQDLHDNLTKIWNHISQAC